MTDRLAASDLETEAGRIRYLEASLGLRFSGGNDVQILQNGAAIFPAMLRAIDAAAAEINLVTFVYWRGDIARRFARALAARARAGVTVRVLLDAYGAARIDDGLVSRMTDAGVEVQWFRPIRRWRLWQCDNRTHRKVLVCDHRVAFTGGVGIAEEWEGDARDPSEWRDTHLRIEGPAVDGLNAAFWNDWLETIAYAHPPACPPNGAFDGTGGTRVLVLRSSATPNGSENAILLGALLHLARRRFHVATAYCVPDETFITMLGEAVERGVDVRIMMPGRHTDQRFDQWASEGTYEALLDRGIRLFRYQKTMLHTKCFIVDDDFILLGSTNLNQRSLKKDNEVSTVLQGAEPNRKISRAWDEDMAACEEVERVRWRRRHALRRLRETLTLPFRQQL